MLNKINVKELEKYRGVILSVALFILLDCSVLILNFYISFEISDDAAAVNLAGRQRMLSQRMTKELFDIQYSIEDKKELAKAILELKQNTTLFDTTLNAFLNGGVVEGADGAAVSLFAVNDVIAKKSVVETQSIWEEFKRNIEFIVISAKNGSIDTHQLTKAIIYAKENNLFMLKNMNILTLQLEKNASSKASRLRLIQTIGISLAIINFFIILFHFLRQLRESDIAIEAAREETTEILETVKEGLFLIDNNLILASQFSSELKNILGIDDLAGRNLNELLNTIVSPKDLHAAEGFIDLLFNPKIKEKLIKNLNPLDQIQVNIEDIQGHFVSKYLAFEFARVFKQGEIINVLVSVRDVTSTVMLSREVDRLKAQENEQLEMLTSILHTNSDLLRGFIEKAFKSFNDINDKLKSPRKKTLDLQHKLEAIFREMHNFKGEASALRLEKFSLMAHEFEGALDELRSKPYLSGNDFLGLTLRLEEFINYTQSIDGLINKLSEFNQESVQEKNQTVNSYLYDFLDELCKKTHKRAKLHCSGLYEYPLDAPTQTLLNEITVQFLRNAIAHGVETPEERKLAQKSIEARIDCHLSQLNNGTIELVFEDDGNGINYDEIRRKAIASGEWSTQEIESWDYKRLLALIFTPGFSTSEHTGLIAGRGFGMDIIKEKINMAKGKLQIRSRTGQGTQFTVILPNQLKQLTAK